MFSLRNHSGAAGYNQNGSESFCYELLKLKTNLNFSVASELDKRVSVSFTLKTFQLLYSPICRQRILIIAGFLRKMQWNTQVKYRTNNARSLLSVWHSYTSEQVTSISYLDPTQFWCLFDA